jgi:hypothetical protein
MSDHIRDYVYFQTHKRLDLKQKLYYGVLDILNFYMKYKTVLLIITEGAANDKDFAESEARIQASLFKRIARKIACFIRTSYCRDSVDEMTIFAICFMIDGYAKTMIKLPNDKMDTVEIANVLAQMTYDNLFV